MADENNVQLIKGEGLRMRVPGKCLFGEAIGRDWPYLVSQLRAVTLEAFPSPRYSSRMSSS